MNVQKFDLNLVPGGVPVYVFADQYDVARTFRATVYDGDELYVFDGSESITICGTKSSGTGFSYDDICSAPAGGSTVTFGLTSQMSVCAGDCICGIILSKDGIVIGTANFIIQFQRNALQEDTIIDSDDFASILTEAVQEWMNDSATAQAVIAQAVEDYLEEHGGNVPETFWATYGTTTYADIVAANTAGKLVACAYSDKVYLLTYITSQVLYFACRADSAFYNIAVTSSNVWANTNKSLPTAYTSTPAALGTASAGSSGSFSRGDHVHAMPAAADIGAIAAPSSPATGAFLVYNGTAWVAQTLATWSGGSY